MESPRCRRRRIVDPSTSLRTYDDDETELLRKILEYRETNHRPFVTPRRNPRHPSHHGFCPSRVFCTHGP